MLNALNRAERCRDLAQEWRAALRRLAFQPKCKITISRWQSITARWQRP